jgi:hypothetical protein
VIPIIILTKMPLPHVSALLELHRYKVKRRDKAKVKMGFTKTAFLMEA